MENATKALLIAAAILIAIIIISFGIFIVRQGQEAVQGADLSEAEAAQLNAQFQMYEGENVSTAQVNALLNMVFIHNQQEKAAGTNRLILVKDPDNDDNGRVIDKDTTSTPRLSGNSYYEVTLYYKNGIVNQINIPDLTSNISN